MPVAPQKDLKTTCEKCGYTHITKLHSDAIYYPKTCSRCGSNELTVAFIDKPKVSLSRLIANVRNDLGF